MELIHEIEYDGKKYPVKEPTIKGWSELMTAKSFEDHLTMAVKLISLSTGLLESEILKANAGSVYSAAEGLIETYTENSEKFNEIITFNGKRYKFVDIKNLTFGEFVDIDDIMVKPESEKINYLPMLMALLYRELDENGHYMEYDTLRIEKTAKEFELLPVRHLNSSMVFFLSYRKYVGTKYPVLFVEQGMVDTESEAAEQKSKNPFGWYHVIVQMAKEDILKIPDVVKVHHIEAFNFITYTYDLMERRNRELKKHKL